jgi:hypothetical protein
VRRDDVQDEVIYRCLNGVCARPLPHRVNYCPFCGVNQGTGLPRPGDAPVSAPVPIAEPVPVSIAKPPPAPVPPQAVPAPAPTLAAAAASTAAAAAQPAQRQPPRAAAAAPPPRREPVRLRYWLLALGVLWLIWITQRPNTEKIEKRIDYAIALAKSCRSAQAQGELIALNDSKATPAQMQRLQAAINEADAACERKRPRAKPAPKPARPPASELSPPPSPSQPPSQSQSQSARNLIADARRALVLGNYKAASSKMEVCAAMVDPDNRECVALKARADRLLGEMQRCVATGRDWISDRCQ